MTTHQAVFGNSYPQMGHVFACCATIMAQLGHSFLAIAEHN